jgi:histone deacetylase 11
MNSGGGFCVYPDITLGIKYLRRFHPDRKKVIIIDLDAHQGNGHERDFSEDPDTFIIDLYNHSIYPGDH